MKIDISVIIPTYNVELFVREALQSVFEQDFNGKIEILVIDDCSTDNTVNIVENIIATHSSFSVHLFRQEKNMKQGVARNIGINNAKGDYIFFLDADDTIDKNAFEKLFTKIKETNYDFVVCDWARIDENNAIKIRNNDGFFSNDILENEMCERLLEARTYFTVNKLYDRKFIHDNHIFFGEGYFYEDYEFYMLTATKANKVAILHDILYFVRVNSFSTTKSNRSTTVHIESLIEASESTVKLFSPRNEKSYYYLYKYIMKKTMNYIRHRTPKGNKQNYVRKIVKILNDKNTDFLVPLQAGPMYHFYFRKKLVQKERVFLIFCIEWLNYHKLLNPIFKFAMKTKSMKKKMKKRT